MDMTGLDKIIEKIGLDAKNAGAEVQAKAPAKGKGRKAASRTAPPDDMPKVAKDTIDARVAVGFELTVIASAVVGGVAIRGGAGTLLGLTLGALTLLLIRNGVTLVRVDPL